MQEVYIWKKFDYYLLKIAISTSTITHPNLKCLSSSMKMQTPPWKVIIFTHSKLGFNNRTKNEHRQLDMSQQDVYSSSLWHKINSIVKGHFNLRFRTYYLTTQHCSIATWSCNNQVFNIWINIFCLWLFGYLGCRLSNIGRGGKNNISFLQ